MSRSVSFVLRDPPRPTEQSRLVFSSRRQERMIDMKGHPLSFAEASYSLAAEEWSSSDDRESVKTKVMSGADATASLRAALRYDAS